MGGKTTTEMTRRWCLANPEKVQAIYQRRYARVRAAREAALAAACAKLMTLGFQRIEKYPAYLISPEGEIYSTTGRRALKIRPGTKKSGYRFVGLKKGARPKYEMVHRLVAMTFIPNPLNLPCVNHLDGDKSRNVVANLEWCSYKQNTDHAYRTGLMKAGLHNPLSKLKPHQVREIRVAAGTYRNIGQLFGVSAQTVCNVKRRSKYADVP